MKILLFNSHFLNFTYSKDLNFEGRIFRNQGSWHVYVRNHELKYENQDLEWKFLNKNEFCLLPAILAFERPNTACFGRLAFNCCSPGRSTPSCCRYWRSTPSGCPFLALKAQLLPSLAISAQWMPILGVERPKCTFTGVFLPVRSFSLFCVPRSSVNDSSL